MAAQQEITARTGLLELEAAEYMVTRLDGAIDPALIARPDSGVVYDGRRSQWMLQSNRASSDGINLDEIYKPCFAARNSMLATANKYRKKLKQSPLVIPSDSVTATTSSSTSGGATTITTTTNTTTTNSSSTRDTWTGVEKTLQDACGTLEKLATADKDVTGWTGKLKLAFRSFCKFANAGQTFTSLIPNDAFGFSSVLCGGLNAIFRGMEASALHREEIYRVLEQLPYTLADHAVDGDNPIYNGDEELHNRAALLYVAVFGLIELILRWFLGNAAKTSLKLILDPSHFSDQLKLAMADMRNRAERFQMRALRLTQQDQGDTSQLIYWMSRVQAVMAQDVRTTMARTEALAQILARMEVLESFGPILEPIAATVASQHLLLTAPKPTAPRRPKQLPEAARTALLEKFDFDPEMVARDCAAIMRTQSKLGKAVADPDRVLALQSNPRLRAWLTLDESSMLLVNGRANRPLPGCETSLVSAKIALRLLELQGSGSDGGGSRASRRSSPNPSPDRSTGRRQSPNPATSSSAPRRQTGTKPRVIPLAFFCGQHRDLARDPCPTPSELGLSLILQLISSAGDLLPARAIRRVARNLGNPDASIPIATVVSSLDELISSLDASVFVIVILDGLRFFADPPSRRAGTRQLISGLVETFRGSSGGRGQRQRQTTTSAATLKFLFASPSPSDFVADLFGDDELLALPRSVPRGRASLGMGGYRKGGIRFDVVERERRGVESSSEPEEDGDDDDDDDYDDDRGYRSV